MWNKISEISSSWWTHDIVVVLFILGIAYMAYALSKREYWRLAYREVVARKGAVVCFFVVMLYALIAILDSFGWSMPLRDEKKEIIRDKATQEIIWDEGQSALDYILAPLKSCKEETYSSPLATHQFTPNSDVDSMGKLSREYPKLKHPGTHIFGTDRVGVDVFYLSLKSIRTGMVIGLLTTLLAIPFAIMMGITAGYFGGWIDDVIQYIYTVMASIPSILFIAAFMIVFGQGLPQLCLAMGIASWTSLCRLLRGETLKLREMEYVQAANAMGVSQVKTLVRHILPNVLHLVLISAVLSFSAQVMAEAALTYLGIGVGADTVSWGSMINDARAELTRDPVIWWKLVAAFVFMLGLVLPANIFGDAVRDALDPRLRTQ